MPDFWENFPHIRTMAWGKLGQRPTRPESKFHAFFAEDSRSLFLSTNDRRWVFAGGSFPRKLAVQLLVTTEEQIVTHEVQLQPGGSLLVDGAVILV
jgi:hypothetical protein